MLCVEDYIDALEWSDSIGGLGGLVDKSRANLRVLEDFVAENDWVHFLAAEPESRSSTSVCLTLDCEPAAVKEIVALLEAEDVAYDIGAYRDAPAGLRIWCGATVEEQDIADFTIADRASDGQLQQFLISAWAGKNIEALTRAKRVMSRSQRPPTML